MTREVKKKKKAAAYCTFLPGRFASGTGMIKEAATEPEQRSKLTTDILLKFLINYLETRCGNFMNVKSIFSVSGAFHLTGYNCWELKSAVFTRCSPTLCHVLHAGQSVLFFLLHNAMHAGGWK